MASTISRSSSKEAQPSVSSRRRRSTPRLFTSFWLTHIQIGEDREHAAVILAGRGKAQLREDAADVLLDSAFGDHEHSRDAAVGAAFRHQGEHLALSRSEAGETIVTAAHPHEVLHEP